MVKQKIDSKRMGNRINNKPSRKGWGGGHYSRGGQMKIQQMTFMIIAVFIFFVFVALFFINWQFKDVKKSANDLNREEAISSLEVLANMPELNCDPKKSLCLDEDKLRVLSGNLGKEYEQFWPVASIKVYKIYPAFDKIVKCPSPNCNYFEIFDNQQESKVEFSTYISICKKVQESSYVFDRCEIGKLVVGTKINE